MKKKVIKNSFLTNLRGSDANFSRIQKINLFLDARLRLRLLFSHFFFFPLENGLVL